MSPPRPATILCLGDSLTEGFGVASAYSYPSLLQQRLIEHGLPIRVLNAGISGDTTQGVLRRLDPLLDTPVLMAIVTIGLNDAFMGIPPSAIHRTLERIIQKLHQHQIQVILSGLILPTDFPPDLRMGFAAIYPDLAADHQLHLIPSFLEGIFEDPEYNQWDNIHPNEAGYRVITEQVWKIIRPLLPPLT
ncbi:MAG: arylesterase [Magnetococcales bacterium]|nr:arylesterase [Magnetococcales bacterium]MBF0150263.1 arylesterase [Magnetococcales bacterium]MBF0172155.1 arylesterase [Magnetococcales bacterium]MBF0347955.1 arylesterase [Magnetococcales bacterium]MBF0630545.1 arylesterase [Magnetococcales bacterium]